MSVRIDWDKLAQLPDDEDKSFEKFCFVTILFSALTYIAT